jgi:Domain of unknown function (DUF3597)
VAAVLRGLAKSKKQKLNYDKSIVDLLNLLDLDSSLTARQELAKELGYSGDTKGSSKMNVWLTRRSCASLPPMVVKFRRHGWRRAPLGRSDDQKAARIEIAIECAAA